MTSLLHRFSALIGRIGTQTLWLVNRLVPKGNGCLINAEPTCDQAIALAHALAGRFDHVTWLVGEIPKSHLDIPDFVRFRRRHAPRGVWAFLRARWVFHTHGIYGNLAAPRTQTVVNLWHGMPIKLLGPLAGQPVIQSTYAISTSPTFQQFLADTWQLDLSKVLVTGLPRYDRMLDSHTSIDDRRASAEIPDGAFVWIWLPTFRHSDVDSGMFGGLESNNLFQLPGIDDRDIDELDEFLEQNDCLLFVKPHPLSITRHMLFHDRPRIKRIDESWMTSRGLTLYTLLSATDGLITDVSGVWIDYLLLDKPIVFSVADLGVYRQTRGVYFDDLETILPGPQTATLGEVKREMEKVCSGHDPYGARRASIRERFHTYTDKGSAERLLKALGL